LKTIEKFIKENNTELAELSLHAGIPIERINIYIEKLLEKKCPENDVIGVLAAMIVDNKSYEPIILAKIIMYGE
jgi:hypothetical protein